MCKTTTTIVTNHPNDGVATYGISIESEINGEIVKKSIADITTDKALIEEFAEKLNRNDISVDIFEELVEDFLVDIVDLFVFY